MSQNILLVNDLVDGNVQIKADLTLTKEQSEQIVAFLREISNAEVPEVVATRQEVLGFAPPPRVLPLSPQSAAGGDTKTRKNHSCANCKSFKTKKDMQDECKRLNKSFNPSDGRKELCDKLTGVSPISPKSVNGFNPFHAPPRPSTSSGLHVPSFPQINQQPQIPPYSQPQLQSTVPQIPSNRMPLPAPKQLGLTTATLTTNAPKTTLLLPNKQLSLLPQTQLQPPPQLKQLNTLQQLASKPVTSLQPLAMQNQQHSQPPQVQTEQVAEQVDTPTETEQTN